MQDPGRLCHDGAIHSDIEQFHAHDVDAEGLLEDSPARPLCFNST